MKRLATTLCLGSLLSAMACSDPPFPADDPQERLPPTADESSDPQVSCKASGWSCNEISECSAGCGVNMGCIDTCKKQGCAAAMAAFDDVTSCAASSCIGDCMSGSGEACDRCVLQKCTVQTDACDAAACPEECVNDDIQNTGEGDPPTGEAPQQQPSCTTTGWTCSEISQCASTCGTNMGCINDCKSKGCDAGRAAFDDVTNCAASSCIGDCLSGSGDACDRCVMDKCSVQGQACEAAECPEQCDNTGGEQPGGNPTGTCQSIFECVKGCFIGLGCVDECRNNGCDNGRRAFDALEGCAAHECGFACMFGLTSPPCVGCAMALCADKWSTCTSSQCS